MKAVSPQPSALSQCTRCGDPGRASVGSDTARPFRKALRGLCTPCAVCSFFQEEENGLGFALPANFDPEGLRLPHIQQQFARILTAGNSELGMEEIDWARVIQKWEIVPFESWLSEVRAALDAINMPMDEWQRAFPYDYQADHAAGIAPAEAAKRANDHYWTAQENARPDLLANRPQAEERLARARAGRRAGL